MENLFNPPTPAPTLPPIPIEWTGPKYPRLSVPAIGPCDHCPQDNEPDDDVSDVALAHNIDLNRYLFNGEDTDTHYRYTTRIGGYHIGWEIICICLIILLCLNILLVSYVLFYAKKQKNKSTVVDDVEDGGYTASDEDF